jgi:DNA-binding response OmpR family regulator
MRAEMKKTILVVDDEDMILRAVKDTLEHAGYTAAVATNGKQAIELFDSLAPDLVITDINMPEVEGIELIKGLSRHTPKVPIIAMSGDVIGASFLKAARLLGAADTLAKPFSTRELLEKIEAVLGTGGKNEVR